MESEFVEAITAVHVERMRGPHYRVGVATMQGLRLEHEDTHTVSVNWEIHGKSTSEEGSDPHYQSNLLCSYAMTHRNERSRHCMCFTLYLFSDNIRLSVLFLFFYYYLLNRQ